MRQIGHSEKIRVEKDEGNRYRANKNTSSELTKEVGWDEVKLIVITLKIRDSNRMSPQLPLNEWMIHMEVIH